MNVFHAPQTTMTPEEAEAVVQRYLTRSPDMPVGPSVADLAEALRLTPEEVGKLLAEVRAEPRSKPKRKSTRRERRVWLLSGVIALIVGGMGLSAMRIAEVGPFQRYGPPNSSSFSGTPYEVYLETTPYGTVYLPENSGPPSTELVKRVQNFLDVNAASFLTPQSYSYQAAQEGIKAAKEGRWADIQGVKMTPFELRVANTNGVAMRWARAVLPVYNGDDSLLADAILRERDARVEAAIAKAFAGIPPAKP